METNPIVPRQRNRRTDRQQTEAVPEQTIAQPERSIPAPQQPAPQPVQVQRVEYGQAQQVYAQSRQVQSPMTMYQQPHRPTPEHPQAQGGYQLPQRPVQPAPRPRAIAQAQKVNSGWQQPSIPQRADAPQARTAHGYERQAARAEKSAGQDIPEDKVNPKTKKIPGWLTTLMSLCFIGVLALVAFYYLMQAYLVTEENRRIEAYNKVLNNYHVTESADGTLRVTWQEEIERYAAQYNLQPAFVTAIIRNESSFRTNAESSVGARGLMQMMPDTAEWIAGKLDDEGYTFDKMWDGETNIRYGCWYLGYLSRLFRGDPELVSAAYHAGQSTVTQWLSDPSKSSDGVHLDLDQLADGPTKQYIGRVTQTYGIYQTLLYPDAAFDRAVSAGGDTAPDR